VFAPGLLEFQYPGGNLLSDTTLLAERLHLIAKRCARWREQSPRRGKNATLPAWIVVVNRAYRDLRI
jgi:hypothetical protein